MTNKEYFEMHGYENFSCEKSSFGACRISAENVQTGRRSVIALFRTGENSLCDGTLETWLNQPAAPSDVSKEETGSAEPGRLKNACDKYSAEWYIRLFRWHFVYEQSGFDDFIGMRLSGAGLSAEEKKAIIILLERGLMKP